MKTVTITGHGATVDVRSIAQAIDVIGEHDSVDVETAIASFDIVGTPPQDISVVSPVSGAYPDYPGPYDLTPSVDSVTFPTRNRTMTRDTTVLAIPYHEVGNDAGGVTVSIAS